MLILSIFYDQLFTSRCVNRYSWNKVFCRLFIVIYEIIVLFLYYCGIIMSNVKSLLDPYLTFVILACQSWGQSLKWLPIVYWLQIVKYALLYTQYFHNPHILKFKLFYTWYTAGSWVELIIGTFQLNFPVGNSLTQDLAQAWCELSLKWAIASWWQDKDYSTFHTRLVLLLSFHIRLDPVLHLGVSDSIGNKLCFVKTLYNSSSNNWATFWYSYVWEWHCYCSTCSFMVIWHGG